MFQSNSQNGVSLKAYKGSSMTLLAMDLDKKPDEGTFAGWTIFYTNPKGERNAIQNLLNFNGTDHITGSDISPIQLFKWVHFPGSYHQTGMLTGAYIYEATPRYFDADKNLKPLDIQNTVKVNINVDDFSDGNLKVGFTRAFIKSQAYSNRFGADQKLVPNSYSSDRWIFDTSENAGKNATGSFTYEDMYSWLGFNAREIIIGILQDALSDKDIKVDMFAYDFNDPVIASMCLELAKRGKIRIILDNAKLHSGPKKDGSLPKEDQFENMFKPVAKSISEIFRCKFGRYSHCKEIILSKNNIPYKVLTGSTNFSTNGLYINANHVLVFEDKSVAGYYSNVFNACWHDGEADSFRENALSNKTQIFNSSGLPDTEINVSPHNAVYAKTEIDSITAIVKDKQTESVLFSVMDMGNSGGSLIPALREIHTDDSVFSYGVTDNANGEISLYKPGHKDGLLIDAKKANRELPPPFKEEFNLGLAHAIHHKIIVTNFNKDSARVYCGSSNLALGGEEENGDNLLCIKDQDVATVFAIEAFRLTDHYNFRSVKDKSENPKPANTNLQPAKLDNTGEWVNKFFDSQDIRYVERNILA